MRKKNRFKSYNSEHTTLSLFLLMSTIILFIGWLYRDVPEIFNGGDEIYDYIITIVLGYLVSYVFYYINIYRPKRRIIIDTCNYIGDCISYMIFNDFQLSDTINKDYSELEIIFLDPTGINTSFTKGIDISARPPQFVKPPVLIRKEYSLLYRKLISEKTRNNIPRIEYKVIELLLLVLGHDHRFNNLEIKTMSTRSELNNKIKEHFEQLKNENINEINRIIKRVTLKLELLIKNEINLKNKDLAIIYGDTSNKLKDKL